MLLKLGGVKFQTDQMELSIWHLLPHKSVKANRSSKFRKELHNALDNMPREVAR